MEVQLTCSSYNSISLEQDCIALRLHGPLLKAQRMKQEEDIGHLGPASEGKQENTRNLSLKWLRHQVQMFDLHPASSMLADFWLLGALF